MSIVFTSDDPPKGESLTLGDLAVLIERARAAGLPDNARIIGVRTTWQGGLRTLSITDDPSRRR